MEVQTQLDRLSSSLSERLNQLEADFKRSKLQAVQEAHDQIKEILAMLEPASFHQATVYFCLKSVSTTRSTKACFAAGSLLLIILQVLAITAITLSTIFASCVDSDNCVRGAWSMHTFVDHARTARKTASTAATSPA